MNVENKILPDFLVVGVMKEGSTTLMDYLVNPQGVSFASGFIFF